MWTTIGAVQVLLPIRSSKPGPKIPSRTTAFFGAVARGWHLFSLDAPTVAAAWCCAFLSVADAPLRATAMWCPVVFLSGATWLCYVGDRVLDARSPSHANDLRARHHFYGALWRERRGPLLAIVALVMLVSGGIAVLGLSSTLFRGFAAITCVSLLYFGWIHLVGGSRAALVSKEGAVAIVFASACVLPAWSATRAVLRLRLDALGVLFGVLCWLNCVAIERWESDGVLSSSAHPTTQWGARHLTWLLIAGAAAAGALGRFERERANSGIEMLSVCLVGAFMLLALLEKARHRFSPETLRILADAALLTPLLWWVAARIVR